MSASLQAGARKKKHKICLKKSQKILNLTQIIRTLNVPALTEIPPQDPSPCPLYIVLWPLNVLVHKPDYPQNPPSIFESLKKELTFIQPTASFNYQKNTHTVRYFVRQFCLKMIFCNKKVVIKVCISFRQFRAEI